MSKILIMNLAFTVLDQMVAQGKLTAAEYVESIDSIKQTLNINDHEYMESLELGWDSEPTTIKN